MMMRATTFGRSHYRGRRAFTLIELLIVVGIIAILAAIAVPNFLEAQVRAKSSRVQSDMRTLVTGLESYAVDAGTYPLCNNEMLPGRRPQSDAGFGVERCILERLSTPVAYLTQGNLLDPFKPRWRIRDIAAGFPQGYLDGVESDGDMPLHHMIKYGAMNPSSLLAEAGFADVIEKDGPASRYILFSSGPDQAYTAPGSLMEIDQQIADLVSAQFYDPTNGTVSYGDLWRVGGSPLASTGWGSEFWRQARMAR